MKIIALTQSYESRWIKDSNGKMYPVLPTNMLSKIYFGVMHCSNGHEADEEPKYYQSPNTYFDLCLAKYDDETGDMVEDSMKERQDFLRKHKEWYTTRNAILKKPHLYVK